MQPHEIPQLLGRQWDRGGVFPPRCMDGEGLPPPSLQPLAVCPFQVAATKSF